MSVTLIDLAPWGFAPGDSLVFCIDCSDDTIPIRAHRHSIRCTEHALTARFKDIREAEGMLVEDVHPACVATTPPPIPEKWIQVWEDLTIVASGILMLVIIYMAVVHL